MGVLKIRSGGVWIPVAQSVGISSPGYVGHAVAGSSTPSVGATVTDVGASVTFTAIAGRTYKTTVLSSRMDQFTTNSPGAFMGIYDGANAYKGGSYQALVAGGFGYINTFIIESNLSGSTTRKARTNTNAGVMNVQAGSVLLVEDITTATEGGLATAWTAFTPTLTQGATVAKTVTQASYVQTGKTVSVQVVMSVTGAGTSGQPIKMGLPVAARNASAVVGSGSMYDASASFRYVCEVGASSVTEAYLAANGGSTDLLGVSPVLALASGDSLRYSATYEAA